MKNDMKLIMENWRRSALEEQEAPKIETVKDFRMALAQAMAAKDSAETRGAGKSIAKNTLGGLLATVIPGAAAAKSLYDSIKAMYYNWPDERRTNTALDALNIDDDVSAVLDDRVENQFIKDWLKRLEGVPGETKLGNIDMNRMLSDFIKDKYQGTIVKKS